MILAKDLWDCISTIAPILLSFVAILISLWNSFWSQNIKRIESNLVWDYLNQDFFIIIRNTGQKSLIIKSITLIAYDENNDISYELGKRDNVWNSNEDKGYILKNEMIYIKPILGSTFDVFAYKGHGFDVTEEMENLNVIIKITDIDGKKWTKTSDFTLGEIEKILDGNEIFIKE